MTINTICHTWGAARGLLLVLGLLICPLANAHEVIAKSKGQAIYLPIYSHMYYGNKLKAGGHPRILLSALVSIRNTDSKRPVRILSARYFDTRGQFLRDYLNGPVSLAPFATTELFVDLHDESGGSGANFLIQWDASEAVSTPLVQAIHANMDSGKAVIFTSQGEPMPIGD